jgi:hypothetical protein
VEKKSNVFKCPNDLNVTVKKDNGETVVNEDCCTSIVVLLKNSGDIATSFLGLHNKSIIKCLDRATKKYFKILKKTLKTVVVEEDNTQIVSEDLPEDMKLTGNGLNTKHDEKIAEEERVQKDLQNGNLDNLKKGEIKNKRPKSKKKQPVRNNATEKTKKQDRKSN